jgi:serine/threonine protein kinase
VKPENILFDVRGVPKLIDFGIAYVYPDPSSVDSKSHSLLSCTYCSGTRIYSAPELFTPSHAHGAAADFWSLGVVLFEMLFLAHPFLKHCPREFMKFATKYSAFLERSQPKGETSGFVATQLSTVTTRRRCEVLLTDEDGSNGNSCASHRPSLLISELPKIAIAPVDNASVSTVTPIDPADALEDLDAEILPSHLRVHIPLATAYGDRISSDCFEFLDELFDIRHDRRLGGTETRYGDFVRHRWLQVNGIHIPNLVKSFMNTSLQTNSLSQATGSHCPPEAHSSPSHPYPSPIKLNHEALRALLLKRQCTPTPHIKSSGKYHRQKFTGWLCPISDLITPKPNRVLPQDYSPELWGILDSYHFPCHSLPSTPTTR